MIVHFTMYVFMCRVLPLQIFVNQVEVRSIPYWQLMYNVTNLTCGVTYTIGVSAGNTAGYSRVSQIKLQPSKVLRGLEPEGMRDPYACVNDCWHWAANERLVTEWRFERELSYHYK